MNFRATRSVKWLAAAAAVYAVKLLVRACSRSLSYTRIPSDRMITTLDLLAHQDIGQYVLCRPLAQKVPRPTRHVHMIHDIGMHSFHIGICMVHISM